MLRYGLWQIMFQTFIIVENLLKYLQKQQYLNIYNAMILF